MKDSDLNLIFVYTCLFEKDSAEIKLFIPDVIKTISLAMEVIDQRSNCVLAYILGRECRMLNRPFAF
jgi:hypothetical protein